MKFIGVLEHGTTNKPSLFTLSEKHKTGANYITETVHHFLRGRAKKVLLPKILFVQMKSCTWENKNRYFFAYFDSLVAWGLFHDVTLSFLLLGHRHEDIDQAVSCTSSRLRARNAITLCDLHANSFNVYNKDTTVNKLEQIANFSALCLKQGWLQPVSGILLFR